MPRRRASARAAASPAGSAASASGHACEEAAVQIVRAGLDRIGAAHLRELDHEGHGHEHDAGERHEELSTQGDAPDEPAAHAGIADVARQRVANRLGQPLHHEIVEHAHHEAAGARGHEHGGEAAPVDAVEAQAHEARPQQAAEHPPAAARDQHLQGQVRRCREAQLELVALERATAPQVEAAHDRQPGPPVADAQGDEQHREETPD